MFSLLQSTCCFVVEFVRKSRSINYESEAERAWNKSKGFEVQLRHLELPENDVKLAAPRACKSSARRRSAAFTTIEGALRLNLHEHSQLACCTATAANLDDRDFSCRSASGSPRHPAAGEAGNECLRSWKAGPGFEVLRRGWQP